MAKKSKILKNKKLEETIVSEPKNTYLVVQSLMPNKLYFAIKVENKVESYNLNYLQTVQIKDTEDARRNLKSFIQQNLIKIL
jgi:hypothetical protein